MVWATSGLARLVAGLAIFVVAAFLLLPGKAVPMQEAVLLEPPFFPAACTGEKPAGAALAGSFWGKPPAGAPRHAFSPGSVPGNRYALLDALRTERLRGWGIELGVANGTFSAEILRRTALSRVFSTDMWASDRGHDDAQRGVAQGLMHPYGPRSCVLWARFEEVLHAFPDGAFDFAYIDGYAHTGEEGGQSLRDWYPKVRSGGVFGGHDYSEGFPRVIEAVDAFVAREGLEVHIIGPAGGGEGVNDCCPSWYIVKP